MDKRSPQAEIAEFELLQCREGATLKLRGSAEAVKRAWYGDSNFPWQEGKGRGLICTDTVIARVRLEGEVAATNVLLGLDPAPGVSKKLLVEVLSDATAVEPSSEGANTAEAISCPEGSRMILPGAEHLRRAWYGDATRPWDKYRGFDCTGVVAHRVESHGWVAATNACLGEDPAPGVAKVLLVELAARAPHFPPEVASHHPRLFDSLEEVPSSPRWVAFVRHAQAQHNVDEAFVGRRDTVLTDVGRGQAVAACGGPVGEALRTADVVITSPMRRALQTTEMLLGSADRTSVVHVAALGTERWSAPCDEGTQKSELLADLPAEAMVDWEGWGELPECWWSTPEEDVWARVVSFAAYLRQRPEDRIVFVGHGGFWDMLLGRHLKNCEIVFCDREFANFLLLDQVVQT